MHVGLVPDIEDDLVLRAVEHSVQRDRELHHAQRGAQVAARLRHRVYEVRPDLAAQLPQLLRVEGFYVHRVGHGVQQRRRRPRRLPAVNVVG